MLTALTLTHFLKVSNLLTLAMGTTCRKSHYPVTNAPPKRTATSSLPSCRLQNTRKPCGPPAPPPKKKSLPSISLYPLPLRKKTFQCKHTHTHNHIPSLWVPPSRQKGEKSGRRVKEAETYVQDRKQHPDLPRVSPKKSPRRFVFTHRPPPPAQMTWVRTG